MKSLLVPTDFSECADKAVDVAIRLAKKHKAEIHFFHIVDIPTDWLTVVEKTEKKLYADVTEKVNRLQHQLDGLVSMAEKKEVAAKKFLSYNQNYRGILEHATQYSNDMIVMGSQGASGIREFWIGSNTQRVVRYSEIPVLVVKQDAADLRFDRILLHDDFEIKGLTNFAEAVRLSKEMKAAMDLLIISTPNNFFETKEAEGRLSLYRSAAPAIVGEATVYNAMREEDGLVEFCEEKAENEMLAFLYDHKAPRNGYTRRHLEQFVNHVPVSILVIPAGVK